MTRPDLDAILARVNAATPGPWWRANHASWEVEARPNQLVADCGSIGAADADATFIAAARTDIPALVAYARELEATLANERGEGEPPVEGWKWEVLSSLHAVWIHPSGAMVQRALARNWYWTNHDTGWCPSNMHPTARAAMRAASVPA